MRLAIVGECPASPGAEPLAGDAGRRLARLLDTTLEDLRQRTLLLNVFDEPQRAWSPRRARSLARALADRMVDHGVQHALLLGRRVAAAFDASRFDWFERADTKWIAGNYAEGSLVSVRIAFYVSPHTSGRCRWWNSVANRRRALIFYRRLAARLEPSPLACVGPEVLP